MVNPHDVVRIAAQAICHPRTVSRTYAGQGSDWTRVRIAKAAQELGLPAPPDRSARPSPSSRTPSPDSPQTG